MIQKLSDGCLFIGLSDFEVLGKELQHVNETLQENPGQHVILDFSRVRMLTSPNLSNLMILRNLLEENGQTLILCNVSFQIKCVFTACGLREIFHFAEDKHSAMEMLV